MSKRDMKISVQNLHKKLGPRQVLRGVDLEVAEGQSLVVIGGSGSGKSVMLKCIIGLMKADKGAVMIDGRNIARHSEGDRRFNDQAIRHVVSRISFVLTVCASGKMSPSDCCMLSMSHARRRRKRRLRCLVQVGLAPEVGNLTPSELSGGMQKRVSLARAIASDPQILFFDEPTTGLDPIMADVINNLIVERVKALGATAISITHDMASARKIADEIAMLYQGRIIWRGKPEEIENANNPMVDQFVNGRAEGPITMAVREN